MSFFFQNIKYAKFTLSLSNNNININNMGHGKAEFHQNRRRGIVGNNGAAPGNAGANE
jgi:hypothetical protein